MLKTAMLNKAGCVFVCNALSSTSVVTSKMLSAAGFDIPIMVDSDCMRMTFPMMPSRQAVRMLSALAGRGTVSAIL